MKRVTFLFTLAFLCFMTLSSVFANNLNKEEILVDLEAIQVGAFKERKNILEQNRLFSHYNTFIEYGENFSRFYIVNIKKEDFEDVIADVKLSAPTAFLASNKIKKLVKNKIYKERTFRVKNVKKMPYYSNGELNSDTILKTRKKFF